MPPSRPAERLEDIKCRVCFACDCLYVGGECEFGVVCKAKDFRVVCVREGVLFSSVECGLL